MFTALTTVAIYWASLHALRKARQGRSHHGRRQSRRNMNKIRTKLADALA